METQNNLFDVGMSNVTTTPAVSPAMGSLGDEWNAPINIERENRVPEHDKFQRMGVLMKALDIVGRPGYAAKAVIANYLDNKDVDVLKSAWDGLSGEQRDTANELWKRVGVEGVPLLGFASEVALDPLMYGGYNALGKIVRGGAEAIGKVPVVQSGIKMGGEYLKPLRRLITTKSENPELNVILDKTLGGIERGKGEAVLQPAAEQVTKQALSRRTGMTIDQINRRQNDIRELMMEPQELAARVPNMLPEELAMARVAKSHHTSQLVEEMKRGVPVDDLNAVRSKDINKLQKNLETLRNVETVNLSRIRGSLVKELNTYADKTLNDNIINLKDKAAVLQKEAQLSHINGITNMNKAIDGIGAQLNTLEQTKLSLLQGGRQGGIIEKEISKLDKTLKAMEQAGPNVRAEVVEKMGINGELPAKGTGSFSDYNKAVTELTKRKGMLLGAQEGWRQEQLKPLQELDKQIMKLENQYWHLNMELADRLVPNGEYESVAGKVFVAKMNEIAKHLTGDIEVNLGTHGVKLAKDIMKTEGKMGKLPQTELGVPKGEARKLFKSLTELRAKKEFGYTPRIASDELKSILQTARIGRAKIWTTQHSSTLPRTMTGDYTLNEVNDMAKAGLFKGIAPDTIKEYFISDPTHAAYIRNIKSAKAIGAADFFKSVSEAFGKPFSEATDDMIKLNDNVTKLNPVFKDMYFPREIASEIGRVTDYYINPLYKEGMFDDFLQKFDALQALWKKAQLAIFPKYHLRNIVGNEWNMYLAGYNHDNDAKGIALQAYEKYKRQPAYAALARKSLKSMGISDEEAYRLTEEIKNFSITKSGQFSGDLGDNIVKQIGGRQGILNRGMAVGSALEDNAKIRLYLDGRLTRKLSPEEAALRTKKFLFDYADLTYFERTVMKRLFPFYTWTRKNLPLQLEMLWKEPQKFAPLATPMRNRDPNDLLKLKYTNPNLYQRLPIELKTSIDKITFIPLDGVLPAADLAKLAPSNWQDLVTDLLTPFVKTPVEMRMNKSFYSGQPIENYAGERQQIMGVDMPSHIRYLMLTVSPAARITRELDKMVDKGKKHEDLTPMETALAFSLSTVYKSDVKTLTRSAYNKVTRQINELKGYANRAFKDKRMDEYHNVLRTINDTYRVLKEVMHK